MAIESQEIEQKKDAVLQKVNDLLEKFDWGNGCERLVIKVAFEGRFNLKPFQIHQKEPVRLYFNSNDIGKEDKPHIKMS